ncbi:MAG: YqgE/AlgH family protein [Rhodobacteraceae bacterium]|nr:YqgE/AlgH family protein [Paracoccaceae bacterium]
MPAFANSDLTGQLLIAMPGMGDPRFEKSVVFICAHSDEGSMGLIVNKPTPELPFEALLKQLDIDVGPAARQIRVHFGGPVENGRGFVLHSADYDGNDSTLKVDDDFGMTATLDILEDLARGKGPDQALLALGYAGWGPGQLEDEIIQNGWLTAEAAESLVFAPDDAAKWTGALNSLGIDPLTLSAAAGRA